MEINEKKFNYLGLYAFLLWLLAVVSLVLLILCVNKIDLPNNVVLILPILILGAPASLILGIIARLTGGGKRGNGFAMTAVILGGMMTLNLMRQAYESGLIDALFSGSRIESTDETDPDMNESTESLGNGDGIEL